MKGQHFHLFLRVVIGLLAAGLPTLLAWTIFWPMHKVGDDDSLVEKSAPAEALPTRPPEVPGPEEFGKLVFKPLQQELVPDGPLELPGQRQTALKISLPPSIKLLATMIESERSAALFSTDDGALKWCYIGESIHEARPMEVVAIEPGKAVVRYLGQETTLQIATESDSFMKSSSLRELPMDKVGS